MSEEIPLELASNVAYYKTAAAVATFSSYGLSEEEVYLFSKYYHAGDSVLDLACGMGRTTLLLHEMGIAVRGVDYSTLFIEIAKRRFPYLDLRIGSYEKIEENDSSFDHVLISICGIDCAFPEEQRMTAIRECARVLKPGGTLICSSHNIKSLHFLSPYYNNRARIFWKLRNTINAFKEKCYIKEGSEYLFYAAPDYTLRQIRSSGLELLEIRGFGNRSERINRYFSPYLHFVFTKPRP